MRLIAYVRVSSTGQKDNTSLDNQIEQIRAYADRCGHEIVAVHREMQSAAEVSTRRELKKVLADIHADKADGLIVWKLDRFARSTLEGLQTVVNLKHAKKHLVVLDLNLDTSTPIGECMLTMLLSFAQLERGIIRERMLAGKSVIRERNGYVHGQPPYGWVAGVKDGRRTLLPEPTEQYWREKIVQMRQEGYTYKKIAGKLNDIGIPAKLGGPWCWASIKQICTRHSVLAEWARGQQQAQ